MFPIATLDIDGEPVWLTVGGVELRGSLRTLASGRRVFKVCVGGRKTVELPAHTEPTAWRPVDPGSWPVPLPSQAVSGSLGALAAEIDADGDSIGEHDWWASGQLHLGSSRDKPETPEEAEARFLRALRTADYIEHHTRDDMRPMSAWPAPLIIASACVRRLLESSHSGQLGFLQRADYDDFHVDRSRLDARRELWLPTPRDIGDLEAGVLKHLDGSRRIWEMRSANPPYSWRQIADAIHRHRSGVKPMYLRSRQRSFEKWLSA